MIKKKKNVEPKEKNKNKPLIEPKQKINITEKNQPCKSAIIPLKRIKTSTAVKKRFNKNSKIHNSISSKEEIKKKTSPSNIRNRQNNQNLGNNNTNSNKLFSSNNLFSTRDTDSISKENDQKFKNYYIKNYSNFNKTNLTKGNDIFKKNFLKQTIIIDNEGNNNLNLNLNHIGTKDYKNILNENKNKNEIFNDNIDSNNSINLFCNTDANSLFESSNYTNNSLSKINKLNDMKQTDIDKNEEEKRIKEYTKIFNLLNTNIEQFKKMFKSNAHSTKVSNINKDKIPPKNKYQNNPKNKTKKALNPNKKQTKQKPPQKVISNSVKKVNNLNTNQSKGNSKEKTIKKNLSEKNLSSSSKRLKTTQNIFTVDVRNDIEKDLNSETKIIRNESNNAISSFLESSIQDDFYQSLINRDFSNSAEEDKIIRDDIISINIDEKGNGENIQDIQDSKIFKAKFENDISTGDEIGRAHV